MSTPTEYQRLKDRIAALADEWEALSKGRNVTFDAACITHELRALLEDA